MRIIAATNRNLEQMIQQNQFREDLFYRLKVVRLELPPLRDRPEDLEQLTQHFLSTTALRRGFKRLVLAESVMKRLRDYTFPGNVRECGSCRTPWNGQLSFQMDAQFCQNILSLPKRMKSLNHF